MKKYKVEIININNESFWAGQFDDKAEAKKWANSQIGKPNRSFEEIVINILDQTKEIEDKKRKEQFDHINAERKLMLYETDWTQLADSELEQKTKVEYREYRKYLRRIPELYKKGQVAELKVMSFEEWKKNKPVYKD